MRGTGIDSADPDIALELLGGSLFNGLTLLVATTALIAGILAAYYARRALFPPKRQLTLHQSSPTSALSSESLKSKGISLAHNGNPLKEPYLITISMENTGRHAITSEDFDQSRPLSIELGAQSGPSSACH